MEWEIVNDDFKRLWWVIGTVVAYSLGSFFLIGSVGAMYYIGVAYWKYMLIAFVSFTIWFVAGWVVVTRKGRSRKAL
jgi:multidrug transporter EmrE-like cation transporter